MHPTETILYLDVVKFGESCRAQSVSNSVNFSHASAPPNSGRTRVIP